MRWLALGLCLAMASCALPPPEQRTQHARALAASHGWTGVRLPAGRFSVQAFLAPQALSEEGHGVLTVYLEGDGLVALDRHTPSHDPTPVDPLALRLALADPQPNVAYLARPCQYRINVPRDPCDPRHWGSHRFAPEVVEATSQALDQIKARMGARALRLVGHSGGAALAALVTARRTDVVAWASVAGNLDTEAWVQALRLSPLHGSLNPRKVAGDLRHLPQVHLIGEADRVVPERVLGAFLQAMDGTTVSLATDGRVVRVPHFDHVCCWARDWPRLRALLP